MNTCAYEYQENHSSIPQWNCRRSPVNHVSGRAESLCGPPWCNRWRNIAFTQAIGPEPDCEYNSLFTTVIVNVASCECGKAAVERPSRGFTTRNLSVVCSASRSNRVLPSACLYPAYGAQTSNTNGGSPYCAESDRQSRSLDSAATSAGQSTCTTLRTVSRS